MFSQWAPLEVADSSCTIRHGLHNNQFYCSFFESPSYHNIYKLIAALPKPTRRHGSNHQSPRRKKEEGDPPLLISSHSNYRLRRVRHAAPQKRVGFDRELERDGRGEVFAVQLRGELSVGGEVFVDGIRATPRASR